MSKPIAHKPFPENIRRCSRCGYSAPVSQYKHEGRFTKDACPEWGYVGYLMMFVVIYVPIAMIYAKWAAAR